jgi:hypothetical protein
VINELEMPCDKTSFWEFKISWKTKITSINSSFTEKFTSTNTGDAFKFLLNRWGADYEDFDDQMSYPIIKLQKVISMNEVQPAQTIVESKRFKKFKKEFEKKSVKKSPVKANHKLKLRLKTGEKSKSMELIILEKLKRWNDDRPAGVLSPRQVSNWLLEFKKKCKQRKVQTPRY